jgi:hypothetical protein
MLLPVHNPGAGQQNFSLVQLLTKTVSPALARGLAGNLYCLFIVFC